MVADVIPGAKITLAKTKIDSKTFLNGPTCYFCDISVASTSFKQLHLSIRPFSICWSQLTRSSGVRAIRTLGRRSDVMVSPMRDSEYRETTDDDDTGGYFVRDV